MISDRLSSECHWRQMSPRRRDIHGKGFVNSIINELLFGVHISGYQYCGPGIKFLKRLARDAKLTFKRCNTNRTPGTCCTLSQACVIMMSNHCAGKNVVDAHEGRRDAPKMLDGQLQIN
ncbi:hypothetical protein PV328_007654 [Microctonus aethiopoides]|uniref:Uncharacterized protein n=1 Tax=Microctonus aethiopoides TaxID=144406 RepID=A0AA39C963_9HYME|nr:hypothetical protein PV328_007654 [Microctonus aethiopoides]